MSLFSQKQGPVFSGISSNGCQVTDTACICNNAKSVSLLKPIIQKSCSTEEIQGSMFFFMDFFFQTNSTLSLPFCPFFRVLSMYASFSQAHHITELSTTEVFRPFRSVCDAVKIALSTSSTPSMSENPSSSGSKSERTSVVSVPVMGPSFVGAKHEISAAGSPWRKSGLMGVIIMMRGVR